MWTPHYNGHFSQAVNYDIPLFLKVDSLFGPFGASWLCKTHWIMWPLACLSQGCPPPLIDLTTGNYNRTCVLPFSPVYSKGEL